MNTWRDLLPSDQQKVSRQHHKMFWYWITERQKIWHRRFVEKVPPPWTKDPILRDRKFCNVYRSLDLETQWVLQNIAPIDDTKWRWFAALVFRLFNRGVTFDEIGIPDPYGWVNTLERRLRKIKKRGENPFTNAYLVHSGGAEMAAQSIDRIGNYVRAVKFVRSRLDWFRQIDDGYAHEQHEDLMTIPSVGPFIAYQIWQDLCLCRLLPEDPDFVVPGPGSLLGLRLLFPSWRTRDVEPARLMLDLRDQQFKKLPAKFPYWKGRLLSVADVQNALCETAKYWKATLGVGKQRHHFIPRSPNTMYDGVLP